MISHLSSNKDKCTLYNHSSNYYSIPYSPQSMGSFHIVFILNQVKIQINRNLNTDTNLHFLISSFHLSNSDNVYDTKNHIKHNYSCKVSTENLWYLDKMLLLDSFLHIYSQLNNKVFYMKYS